MTETHQLIKHTRVQRPLPPPTLPQLLVVVVQALPMRAELLQARLVHVIQHARGAAGDLATLAQAICLALAIGLGLALHVVVIVGFAAGADEEGGAEERGRGGADFGHRGDRGGEGRGVD